MGGREFDGAITINRWYEAKSGNFWRDHTSTPQKFAKFKSDMSNRLKIATKNGATYELHSNTPIPKDVKEFLNKKVLNILNIESYRRFKNVKKCKFRY